MQKKIISASGGESTNEEIISSAKPLRLICKNENEKEYIHGSVIRKEFELLSNIKSDAYDVTISSCDGVEMVKQPAYVNDEFGNSSVVLEFRMCDSYEFGKVRFKVSPSANTNVSLKEVEYIEQSIYCYHDSNSDYVSTVCYENLSAYSEKDVLGKVGEPSPTEEPTSEPTSAPSVIPTFAPDFGPKTGDVNCDFTIDVTDLSELSLALIGDRKLSEAQQKAADVDGDGKVTLSDLARMRQYLSKIITSFD